MYLHQVDSKTCNRRELIRNIWREVTGHISSKHWDTLGFVYIIIEGILEKLHFEESASLVRPLNYHNVITRNKCQGLKRWLVG